MEAEERKPVKVWDTYEAYKQDWEKEFEEENSKLTKKIADFFKYDIGYTLREKWHNTKWFFKNIGKFVKLANEWRPWDYHYIIDLLCFGLNETADYMDKNGHEENVSKNKKIAAIHELVDELNRDYEDEYDEKNGNEYNLFDDIESITKYDDGSTCFSYKENEEHTAKFNKKMDDIAEYRKKHYEKIFRLIIGQDTRELAKLADEKMAKLPEEERTDSDGMKHYKYYMELFDGSGIEGWWD